MREIDPKKTNRALSYKMFINAPMPMVTILKTIDITKLFALVQKRYKFNMLMCYCIGQAANHIPEFKMLPVGKKIFVYDKIGINVIVANKLGSINSCDIPYAEDLEEFNENYLKLTRSVREKCESYNIDDSMVVGTSNLRKYNIDGAINMYSGIFNNPFLVWGKYLNESKTVKLRLSFQFHHVQMDGQQACQFLEELQECITRIKNV
jgi:chloramphenicol O-acetyltransferase type A